MTDAPLLDLRAPTLTDPYTVVDPEVATAGGYRVEVERRLVERRAAGAARFTTPEGRSLNVCWVPSSNRVLRGKALLEDLTCVAVSKMFGKMTPAAEADLAVRLSAVVEAGFAAVRAGVTGEAAHARLRVASLCLSDEVVEEYQRHLPVQTNLFTIAELRDGGVPPEQAASFIYWFNDRVGQWQPRYRKASEYPLFGAYARQGWSAEEFAKFSGVWSRTKTVPGQLPVLPPVGWAVLPSHVAILGAQAGMKVSEIRRLVANGEWDDDAVRLLTALSPVA